MYDFNDNTSPKEIIACAISEIAEFMQADGFNFLKRKLEIRKESEFRVSVYPQMNRWNKKGQSAEIWLHCTISDRDGTECFWSKTLSFSNAKQGSFHSWEFYGKEQYDQSMREIKEIISQRFLPYIRRMDYDPMAIVAEVAEKGFCIFADEPVYDAGFQIPTAFLLRYGTHTQLTTAFQNYIDCHQLSFVKPMMKHAIASLKENKKVINNGERDNAEFVIMHNIELKF